MRRDKDIQGAVERLFKSWLEEDHPGTVWTPLAEGEPVPEGAVGVFRFSPTIATKDNM